MHPRYTCHAPRARIPCKKNHAGHMRAPPCARTTSLTDFLNFWSRGPPHRPWHRHRAHLLHRQMDISIVSVVLFRRLYCRAVGLSNIAVGGAMFIIAADVVDVILSSRTCEYRRRDLLHHQRTQTTIGIEDHHRCRHRSHRRHSHHLFCQTSCGWEGGIFARALETTA